MEHLSVERIPNGFKVGIKGDPQQIYLMLSILVADICENFKIDPVDLGNDLPRMVKMAVERGRRRSE